MAKPRGIFTPAGAFSTSVTFPSVAMAKTAMLSWPRFETYTNFPFGWQKISAVLFLFAFAASGGRVLIVWMAVSVPFAASCARAVMLLGISSHT